MRFTLTKPGFVAGEASPITACSPAIAFFCAALLLASPPAGLVAQEAAAIEAQQAAMILWFSGDYDRAIEALESVYQRFPNERRGRTAYYHIALQLENTAMVEVESFAEARSILERSRSYYQKTMREVPGQEDHVRERALEADRRVAAKLLKLEAIESGERDYLSVQSDLGAMELDGLAATYLLGLMLPDSPENHELIFLALIHQSNFVDGLNHRIEDAYSQLRGPHPDLFTHAFEKYMPKAEAAAARAVQLGKSAIEIYPASLHRLDYHVYLGEAYRYEATSLIARHDRAIEKGDQTEAGRLAEQIVVKLSLSRAENEKLIARAKHWMEPGADSSPFDQQGLESYVRAARERVAEVGRLAVRFQASPSSTP